MMARHNGRKPSRVRAGGRLVALVVGTAIVILGAAEVRHLTGGADTGTSATDTSTPATSPPTTEAAAAPIPIYDTAWLAPAFSLPQELDEYFAHLHDAGFTGTIMMLTAGSATWPERLGKTTGKATDYVDNTGKIRIEPGHVTHLRLLLDKAQANGLTVGLAPSWEQDSVCGGHAKRPAILNANNAYDFGVEVARAVGSHPAVAFWLFGGDAESGPDGKSCYADVNVWRQMAKAFDDNGARQPVGYHTARGSNSPGLQQRHIKWATESWVDVLMPQTGQCNSSDVSRSQLAAVQAYARTIGKPVFSIEMRYESTKGLAPSFCGTSAGHRQVNIDDMRADAQAAVDLRVDALVYGHHDRWQWGNSSLDESVGSGGGFDAVRRSFGSPGEVAYLDEL